MSRRKAGAGFFVAAVAAVGLLSWLGDNPSTPFADEGRTCDELLPYEDCKDGVPYCPPPKVCAVESSTTSVVATIVPEAPESTEMPPLATVAPETTVVPMAPASTDTTLAPTAAPVEAPPETPAPTEPPATEPPATSPPTDPPTTAPRPQRTDRCGPNNYTVQPGDGWNVIARKMNVSARELAAVNGTTTDGALWPGDSLCMPKGSGSTTTQAPPQTSGQPPTTTAAPTTTTQASATTQPRRPPGSERTTTSTIKPVWVDNPPPTTAAAQPATTRVGPGTVRTTVPPSPVTTRPGPGTVRTTAPPCPGC